MRQGKTNRAVIVAVAAMAGMGAGSAMGAAVLTMSNGITGAYSEESITDATGFSVSNSDLLEGLIPDATLSDLGPGPGSEGTNSSPAVLTDGNFGNYYEPPTPRPYIFTTSSNANDATDYTKLYYILSATPGGHAITSIDTYTSMTTGSGRDRQDYIVSYATVANPTASDFTQFAEVHAPYHPGSQHMRLTIGNLSGVTALKFEFPAQIANFVGYREIDVNAVPEPASLGLLALGGLGLLARRRRA